MIGSRYIRASNMSSRHRLIHRTSIHAILHISYLLIELGSTSAERIVSNQNSASVRTKNPAKLGYIVPAHIGFLRTAPRGVTIKKDGITQQPVL